MKFKLLLKTLPVSALAGAMILMAGGSGTGGHGFALSGNGGVKGVLLADGGGGSGSKGRSVSGGVGIHGLKGANQKSATIKGQGTRGG